MQQVIKKILKKTALPLYLELRSLYYKGDNVNCPCCKGSFSQFLPLGVAKRLGQCPYCRSNERDRALRLYMDKYPDFIKAGKKLLHVGPEAIFYNHLKQLKGLDYIPADKFAKTFESTYPADTIYLDITHMPEIADNTFDVILCSHVLEYVKEDITAINELHRVLKPGGLALLQVPVKVGLEVTHEDESINTSQERARMYGDPGHIRYYGADYAGRLSSQGFKILFVPFTQLFSAEEIQRHGLVSTDDFHLCTKAI